MHISQLCSPLVASSEMIADIAAASNGEVEHLSKLVQESEAGSPYLPNRRHWLFKQTQLPRPSALGGTKVRPTIHEKRRRWCTHFPGTYQTARMNMSRIWIKQCPLKNLKSIRDSKSEARLRRLRSKEISEPFVELLIRPITLCKSMVNEDCNARWTIMSPPSQPPKFSISVFWHCLYQIHNPQHLRYLGSPPHIGSSLTANNTVVATQEIEWLHRMQSHH